MTNRQRRRVRVERAGGPIGGYLPGWIAIPIERHQIMDDGKPFATWTEAMEYATGGPLVSEATA